jgi:hypothetical protein
MVIDFDMLSSHGKLNWTQCTWQLDFHGKETKAENAKNPNPQVMPSPI